MDTQPIKPTGNNSKIDKSKLKRAAAAAGMAAAGAAVGAAATYAANSGQEEELPDPTTEQPAQQPAQQSSQQPSQQPTQQPSQQPGQSTVTSNEPEPITGDEPIVEEPTVDEPIVDEVVEPEQPVEPTYEDPVNPDEIAEAIISEEQIDPNDIDAAEIINFNEIGVVYTVEGDVYTAASFHDPEGNELMMVDVDGDDIFDVITTPEGDIIAEANGMTVSDAELGITDDDVYLADTETGHFDETNGEDFLNDIITV
ncbi:MAG: hypothetical protein NC343_06745 [Muribaculum sp.]|nr:hypothetical protein [Muribaculaceae bacterium]MCM1081433.1 hypothetical protein [Muribaculum sp.]